MLTRDGGRELAHRHPWLYHVVWKADEKTRETVASDGLVSGTPRHRWHPVFKPRCGHVYLATHRYLGSAHWNLRHAVEDIYAVRTTALLASRVNPDEDHFTATFAPACDQFNLTRPLDHKLWDTFKDAITPYGDWAEQVGLGSDPKHTIHSINRGSVAYAGVVPPTALRRWDEARQSWDHDLVGAA